MFRNLRTGAVVNDVTGELGASGTYTRLPISTVKALLMSAIYWKCLHSIPPVAQ
ncbi:MAG: hypothetical protein O7E52_27600 [Candidatus Poribacteria bacterium]|nr:hypothetical protein [Candidatus Poribacteria bacterium]